MFLAKLEKKLTFYENIASKNFSPHFAVCFLFNL